YLEASRLPDGQLARFYELKTNKPLYFTRDYKLTYRDDDVPTHYTFKLTTGRLKRAAEEYEQLKDASLESLRKPPRPHKPGPPSRETVSRAQRAVEALDQRGRWLEKGRLKTHEPTSPDMRVLRMATFIENVRALSDYLAATREQ
ncbi:MAG TPA: hypothetical protein VG713_12990, partial [Pirellulales bacterium]|nr:hypothetical protein [Pirellulales bacterium]